MQRKWKFTERFALSER